MFYPLNYGNSDNCDFRFAIADCKIEFVGVGVSDSSSIPETSVLVGVRLFGRAPEAYGLCSFEDHRGSQIGNHGAGQESFTV